jgi:uncharacterized protein
MPTPVLEKLMILQERDRRCRDLDRELRAVPGEIAAVEARIASEKAAIDAARQELRELESRKKLLETEIGSAEQKMGRYKTQQLEVRKNDEYRALGLEIEHMQAEIGRLEEQELGVMYGIDEARRRFAEAEAVLKANISGHEARIARHREREVALRRELEEARVVLAAARQPVEEPALRLYDRVAQRSFPAVVPMHQNKCGGCHLKVSGEVESAARARDPKPVTCDQCGRIVWFDANS